MVVVAVELSHLLGEALANTIGGQGISGDR